MNHLLDKWLPPSIELPRRELCKKKQKLTKNWRLLLSHHVEGHVETKGLKKKNDALAAAVSCKSCSCGLDTDKNAGEAVDRI